MGAFESRGPFCRSVPFSLYTVAPLEEGQELSKQMVFVKQSYCARFLL